jgi:hypothetical protein
MEKFGVRGVITVHWLSWSVANVIPAYGSPSYTRISQVEPEVCYERHTGAFKCYRLSFHNY